MQKYYVKDGNSFVEYERSYIDMLVELHNTVESDWIPQDEKNKILRQIENLEAMLEQWSA